VLELLEHATTAHNAMLPWVKLGQKRFERRKARPSFERESITRHFAERLHERWRGTGAGASGALLKRRV
jgi:hypothetical protein